MISTSYIDAFIPEGRDANACINCGICLQKCPVMKMGKEESRAEIQRLINGEESLRVLNECNFCFSCNHYCPKGLNPYSLIMERMVMKKKQMSKDVSPTSDEKDIAPPSEPIGLDVGTRDRFYEMYKLGSAEDKAILDKWEKAPPKSKDTLFVGCFGRSVPQGLENAKSLASLAKFGPREACCGEPHHRFGEYDLFSRTVELTKSHLETLDTQRLVCYCGSCSFYLGHVWPDYHGIKLPFEVISLYEWLWEKVQSGELTFQRLVSQDMAISDACYTSELGDRYFEAIRGLHKAAGMNVIELENNRFDSLCCGAAAGMRSNGDTTLVFKETEKKVDQVLASGTKNVSCNCPGCVGMLIGYSKQFHPGIRVHYAINEILQALGDDV